MGGETLLEAHENLPREKCIISWEAKEGDLAWPRQERWVGEHHRLFHSVGQSHAVGQKIVQSWEKVGIARAKAGAVGGVQAVQASWAHEDWLRGLVAQFAFENTALGGLLYPPGHLCILVTCNVGADSPAGMVSPSSVVMIQHTARSGVSEQAQETCWRAAFR